LGIKGGEEFAGYTFMESLASGLPIVGTYCGGIPEIVGDDNILVTQANRKQLWKALDTYIANPELRSETGIKNRERARNIFDLSKQTRILEKVIKDRLL
jgi:glycosyltransferase involved in cell wall biosynthesis